MQARKLSLRGEERKATVPILRFYPVSTLEESESEGAGADIPTSHTTRSVTTTATSSSKSEGEGVLTFCVPAKGDFGLVRATFLQNGLRETDSEADFNFMWTSAHVKPTIFRCLRNFQRVNHFPRSHEVTRKDRLYANIQRMQQQHSARQFDIVPLTFQLPTEFNQFYAHWTRERGVWIAKPIASSQGRGIHLVEHPSHVSLDEPTVLCRYIAKPFLIDGFKVSPSEKMSKWSASKSRKRRYEERQRHCRQKSKV